MMIVSRPFFQAIFVGLAALIFFSFSAAAQNFEGFHGTPQSLPSGLIQELNQRAPSNQTELSPLDRLRQVENVGPVQSRAHPLPPLPLSQLERDYAKRANVRALRQYGYDLFRSIQPSNGQLLTGAVAENYRLSIGDQLIITFRGQISRTVRARVDREGRVVIPELPPIPAAGRAFGDFRRDLENQTAATYVNTQVYVSVGAVRQISVAVLGEVEAPGIYRLGGFATVLDFLAMARGIKKTGSLRDIEIIDDGKSRVLDIYSLLNRSTGEPDLSISDGARIVVPTIGPTIAVAGDVERPGIYEILPGDHISGNTALKLAGNTLKPNGYRYVKLTPSPSGQDRTSESLSLRRVTMRAGDILLALPRDTSTVGSVYLDGHVTAPGIRSLAVAPTVRRLLRTGFLPDPYLPFGVLKTTNPTTLASEFIPLNLVSILQGRTNTRLKDGDTVIVLSQADINYIDSADVQAVLDHKPPPSLLQRATERVPGATAGGYQSNATSPSGQTGSSYQGSSNQNDENQGSQYEGVRLPRFPIIGTPQHQPSQSQYQNFSNAGTPANATGAGRPPQQRGPVCRGLHVLADIVADARPGRFSNAKLANVASITVNYSSLPNNYICPSIYDRYPNLLPFVVEHAVSIQGDVQLPGLYPVATGTPLAEAVSEAGGLGRDVDLKRVEVTHTAVNNIEGSSQTVRQLVQLRPSDLNRVALSPGDIIRFNAVYSDLDNGPVKVSGEFRRPGLYDIRRGERLSELIQRAGGLTSEAYPYGAVFERTSVRKAEQKAYDRAAHDLESALSAAVTGSSNNQHGPSFVTATESLIRDIKNTPAAGRVVVQADPTVLQVSPQLDTVLQPGDSIFIPKRPNYVTVSGEVLNPTSLQFKPGATPGNYIREAGGYTQNADDDAVFVVLPNGEAEPVRNSFWNFRATLVPPGSTIVVPRDLHPFDLDQFLKDSTGILSNLAISAASLAVVSTYH
ncbi:MAG: SLBB domain-containing protein [Stellaceae bacterium]